jgi:hypothetical protein
MTQFTTRAIICVLALAPLVATNLHVHTNVAYAATHTRITGGTLVSAPVAGPTQATIAVNGSGWQGVPDGTVVTFGSSTDPSCAAASYTPATREQVGVMSGGTFSGWFLWPTNTPVGAYTVCALIGSTLAAVGPYTVLSATPPQLTISSPMFNVGQQAVVSGSNFLPPQTSVTLALQQLSGGTSVPLGTVTSDANGAFTQAYTIPANPTGPVALVASAGSATPPALSASVTFIIYATPVTPTPASTVTPSPSPAPGRTATPTPGKTATPTTIPAQHTKTPPTPTAQATPISLGNKHPALTPTTSTQGTQRLIAQAPSTDSGQSSDKKITALIAGAIFVLLAAILVVLFWRRKAKKQASGRTTPFSSLTPATASLATTPSWGSAQAVQPSAGWTAGSGWGDLPIQQASPSLTVTQASANESLSLGMGNVSHMYRTGKMNGASGTNGTYGINPLNAPAPVSPVQARPSEYTAASRPASPPVLPSASVLAPVPPARSDSPPTSATAPASNDLLQDPLLAAIMQQARTGLYVLPGKKP